MAEKVSFEAWREKVGPVVYDALIRQGWKQLPCDCEDDVCQGWQMKPPDRLLPLIPRRDPEPGVESKP